MKHIENIKEEIDFSLFKQIISDRPKTYEIDFQGVAHNSRYFYWLEWARVEYFRTLGVKLDKDIFVTHDKFMVARQEINYRLPIFFDDKYEILTRISIVKNTSFEFQHLIISNGKLIADSKAVMVHLDPISNLPLRLPDIYREKIKEIDGSAIFIEK